MSKSPRLSLASTLVQAFVLIHVIGPPLAVAMPASTMAVVAPRDASAQETLAAREVRRYLYLRTGRLARILHGRGVPAGVPSAVR